MTERPGICTVTSMRSMHGRAAFLRVVVAGGGVGGLETVVALRALAGRGAVVTVVAPQDEFSLRSFDLFAAFGEERAQRFPLAELSADLAADFRHAAVAHILRRDRVALLQSGVELPYDALVLAVGAFPYPAFDHGVCFDPAHDRGAADELVAATRAGTLRDLAVVIPPTVEWTLPAYELALQLAEVGRVTLVTPEHEPLETFGPAAAALARAELAEAGVVLLAGIEAAVPADDVVELAPGRRTTFDRVVHVPLVSGPNCVGVPCDAHGFVLVDDGFRVRNGDREFAIGDAAAGAFKQGGLAAQQAELVAEQLARCAGLDVPPRPYRPVLRGLLRTPRRTWYLRAEPPGGAGAVEVSESPLWWPPTKVASRWLMPWLALRGISDRSVDAPRRLSAGGLSVSRR